MESNKGFAMYRIDVTDCHKKDIGPSVDDLARGLDEKLIAFGLPQIGNCSN